MGTESAEIRMLETPHGTLEYCFQRKKIKNINVRVKQDGTIRVSAPMRTALRTVEDFLRSRAAFILAAQARFRAMHSALPEMHYRTGDEFPLLGDMLRLEVCAAPSDSVTREGDTVTVSAREPQTPERIKKLLDDWIAGQALSVFTEIMRETAALFADLPVPAASLRIRRMVSRWGSCHTQKHIVTLNRRLIEAPRRCIAYVVIHEFCHFIHADHSAQFYALLERKCPDWRACKTLLEQSVIL